MNKFARNLLSWHRRHGRHGLPWKQEPTLYRTWVSEIMLQQTQVKTVIPYYQQFICRFPTVYDLATADADEVLHLWSGLGYYARARNMQRAAQTVCREFKGEIPDTMEGLMSLPGIGRSTAAAILSLSLNKPFAILDGNVKRVLTRYHAISGWPGNRQIKQQLWQLAEQHTSQKQAAVYNQAIMDLGAMICTRSNPECPACPVHKTCAARNQGIQHSLPQKKPGKTLPVKKTVFAMIENPGGEVMLEKRPPSGIWGGLWSFPECPIEQDLTIWLNARYGYQAGHITSIAKIRHTFSHFHLDILPVRVALTTAMDRIGDESGICWYKPGHRKTLGMATPVKKLIEILYTPAGEQE